VTTTYDPFHPQYLVLNDLREEMDRVYDLCHGCRLCFKFCPSFPTLFDAIDQHDDQDSAKLTDDERFEVVDECFNCKLCGELNCPYTPGKHEWELDFPRLMLRAKAYQQATGMKSAKARVTDKALSKTDLVGTLSSGPAAPLANKALGTPGSSLRKAVSKVVGIHEDRILPPYARTRFSTWFKRHTPRLRGPRQKSVAVFPTCLVEYQDTQVGKDLVGVYERNNVACSLPEGMRCCGAPALHQGDVAQFRKEATHNTEVLAEAIRAAERRGEQLDIVVPQPTCGFVLKNDYPDYLATPDAQLVAEHTHDAADYLVKLHKGDDTTFDTEFTGEVPEKIVYHAPCHLRAQNMGLRSRDLMKLTGAKITVVAECSGIDGTWGLRSEHYDAARGVAAKMAKAIDKADADTVAGDCSLANGGIALETGKTAQHPLSVVARAYGLPKD
jgi:Fe-S oxidoreductase